MSIQDGRDVELPAVLPAGRLELLAALSGDILGAQLSSARPLRRELLVAVTPRLHFDIGDLVRATVRLRGVWMTPLGRRWVPDLG